MSHYAFCTIITPDYWHYALTLFESIRRFDESVELHVFISDGNERPRDLPNNIYCYFKSDLCVEGMGRKLHDRYAETYVDGFRWSMKSVLMKHLLEKDYQQVIWADCDLFFVDDFSFLVDDLRANRFMLTPHRRNRFPQQAIGNFQMGLREGLFNAGFVGANQQAIEILDWWAALCLFRCEKAQDEGYYVDQRYLDLAPTLFSGVKIVQHKGCNIANWNRIECPRGWNEEGKIVIGEFWNPVFLHFTNSTIRGIKYGSDGILEPYLKDWVSTIQQYKPDYQLPAPKKKTWQQQAKQQLKRILKA
ncbi:MAG: hypothetical protein AAGI23_11855 [Bacteroidota bacterium]